MLVPLVTRREGRCGRRRGWDHAERVMDSRATRMQVVEELGRSGVRVVSGISEKRITADFADDADRDQTRTINAHGIIRASTVHFLSSCEDVYPQISQISADFRQVSLNLRQSAKSADSSLLVAAGRAGISAVNLFCRMYSDTSFLPGRMGTPDKCQERIISRRAAEARRSGWIGAVELTLANTIYVPVSAPELPQYHHRRPATSQVIGSHTSMQV